jgi:hypothetical protein
MSLLLLAFMTCSKAIFTFTFTYLFQKLILSDGGLTIVGQTSLQKSRSRSIPTDSPNSFVGNEQNHGSPPKRTDVHRPRLKPATSWKLDKSLTLTSLPLRYSSIWNIATVPAARYKQTADVYKSYNRHAIATECRANTSMAQYEIPLTHPHCWFVI